MKNQIGNFIKGMENIRNNQMGILEKKRKITEKKSSKGSSVYSVQPKKKITQQNHRGVEKEIVKKKKEQII